MAYFAEVNGGVAELAGQVGKEDVGGLALVAVGGVGAEEAVGDEGGAGLAGGVGGQDEGIILALFTCA